MVAGKTKSGFEFEVNEKVLKDWRFVTALADADSGDESRAMQGVTQLVRLLFDDKTEHALVEHVKDEDGIASIDAILAEVKEVFDAIGDNKESKK